MAESSHSPNNLIVVKPRLVRLHFAIELWRCNLIQREYVIWLDSMLRVKHSERLGLGPDGVKKFASELRNDWRHYSGEKGRFYLLLVDGSVRGMGALKHVSNAVCELKRLYIKPMYRCNGFGKMLICRLINDARSLGYSMIRLETADFMTEAIRIYESLGFERVDQFDGAEGGSYGIQSCELFFRLNL